MEELRKLTTAERLAIIEAALRLIRGDLQRTEQPHGHGELKRRLAKAAEALLPNYAAGGELTAFTVLDGEDFFAQG